MKTIVMNDLVYECKYGHYENNGRIALALIRVDTQQITHVLTINLPNEELSNERCAFLNINGNTEEAINLLTKCDYGHLTKKLIELDSCLYPEFEFSEDFINDIKK